MIAPDLLARLNAAGVTVSVKLRLDPRPGEAIPPDLLADANAARGALLAHLIEPPAPHGMDLRGVTNALHDANASPWVAGVPHPDAGPRLLSVLAGCWPADVVKTLAGQHATDLLHLDAGEAFTRLFRAAVDVTRQDRSPPG